MKPFPKLPPYQWTWPHGLRFTRRWRPYYYTSTGGLRFYPAEVRQLRRQFPSWA